MGKNLFLLILLLFFFSCTHQENENFEDLQGIKKGMKLEEVLQNMRNEPIGKEEANWNDSLYIYSYSSPAAASDHYKIIFNKKDSVVVEILLGN